MGVISRSLYTRTGGYKSICLMEDLDLIERLSKHSPIRSLSFPILISNRSWVGKSILIQGLRNAYLRRRWKNGESTKTLSKEYRETKLFK